MPVWTLPVTAHPGTEYSQSPSRPALKKYPGRGNQKEFKSGRLSEANFEEVNISFTII